MPQLNYSIYQDAGFEGALATTVPSTIITGLNAETTAEIRPGRVVVSLAAGGNILPTSTNTNWAGVALYTNIKEKSYGSALAYAYPPKATMNLLQKGEVFIVAETDIAEGAVPFVRHTANGTPGANEAIGRVRADADTSRATQATGFRCMAAVKAGQLARISVNLPQ